MYMNPRGGLRRGALGFGDRGEKVIINKKKRTGV